MAIMDSLAQEPETRDALRSAIAFLARNAAHLSHEQRRAGGELKRRLRRLEAECNRLIKLNNTLMNSELPRTDFDPATGTVTTAFGNLTRSFTLNRADPNVPVKLVNSTAIGIYAPNEASRSPEIEELKVLFESLLEQYYYNAFRITKLLQELTGRTKSHCMEITMVRNQLIEHPQDAADYTFGYGTDGPVVRPMKLGPAAWNDAGLIPNTVALVKHVVADLAR